MVPLIRPAAAPDVPALHALVESAYRGDAARAGWTHEADLVEGPRTNAATLAAIIAGTDEALLVAVEAAAAPADAERVLGCVHVRVPAAGPAYLGMLAVRPDAQAGGLGSRLIAAAEAHALALGAIEMEMTVIDTRAELIDFYRRRGWRETGERRPFPVATARPLAFAVLRRSLAA